MRPRTTTGIRRQQVSDGTLRPSDQTQAHANNNDLSGVQRMRASAPAGISRVQRRTILDSNSRDYLKVGQDKIPSFASQKLNNKSQGSGLDSGGLGMAMEDLSQIVPPSKEQSKMSLDNIFSRPQNVPSYSSTSTKLRALATEQPKPSSTDVRTQDSRHISRRRLDGNLVKQRSSDPSYGKDGLDSCPPPKSRGVVSRGQKDQLAMLRLPPLEGRLARGGDPHIAPHPAALIPRGSGTVRSQAEFTARS